MKWRIMSLVKSISLTMLLAVEIGSISTTQAEEFGDGVKTRPVECLLTVKGKTYLSGTCKYDADPDGSFRLYGKKYFTYLTVFENGTAEASWNADPKSTHAHAPLGELKRDGACWVSTTVKLCAWDKKAVTNKAQRIKFARNATSTVITGKINNVKEARPYLIEVGKGQTMTVEQLNADNKKVTLWLTAPDGTDASDADLSCNNQKR